MQYKIAVDLDPANLVTIDVKSKFKPLLPSLYTSANLFEAGVDKTHDGLKASLAGLLNQPSPLPAAQSPYATTVAQPSSLPVAQSPYATIVAQPPSQLQLDEALACQVAGSCPREFSTGIVAGVKRSPSPAPVLKRHKRPMHARTSSHKQQRLTFTKGLFVLFSLIQHP